jgi:hypothetical protein
MTFVPGVTDFPKAAKPARDVVPKPVPGFLTPSQFAKTTAGRKPGADYQGYVSWVRKTRNQRQNARLQADPYGYNAALAQFRSTLLTPAQQSAQVAKQVNTGLSAALAQIASSYRASQQQTSNQATRAQGYAQALANMTATAPNQIADIYNQAAERLKGWGTGLTGAYAEAEQQANDRATAALAATGTPTATATGNLPVSSYDPAALRNVLQYTGVVAPGKNLQEEAANAAALARFQRASDVSQVGAIAQDYLQKGQALAAEMAGKKADLLATRPELIEKAAAELRSQTGQGWQSFLSALQSSRSADIQQRASDIQAKYLENTLGKTQADITGYYRGTDGKLHPTAETVQAAAKATAKVKAATAKATAKKTAARATAIAKRDTDTVKFLTDARSWAAAQTKPGTEQVQTGEVPLQVGKNPPLKDDKGHAIPFTGGPVYAKKGGGTTVNKNEAIMKPIYEQQPISKPNFDSLWGQLTETLSTQLKRYGYSRKQLRNFAHDVLDDYYTVGEITEQRDAKQAFTDALGSINRQGLNQPETIAEAVKRMRQEGWPEAAIQGQVRKWKRKQRATKGSQGSPP